MLERILEVEVMDTLEEAFEYDAMDHDEVNSRFVDDFLALLGSVSRSREPPSAAARLRLLDLGTGTAQIPIALCERSGAFHVTAADFAHAMLQLGRKNVLRAGLTAAIDLDHVDAKALPYASGTFDGVISNSLLHHLPAPLAAMREIARVLRPGGWLFVRDLLRPADEPTLAQLVETYAAEANGCQRRMFADSLHAALALDEVRQMLAESGLPTHWAAITSDRHWTVAGFR